MALKYLVDSSTAPAVKLLERFCWSIVLLR